MRSGLFMFGAVVLAGATPATAEVYFALGDSITFGETDLFYRQSDGDRGYVSLFADDLATRNGGERPDVFNFAIDGETSASFTTNSGRTPPVEGRGDAPLQLQNLNYSDNAIAQGTLFEQTLAAQRAAGETVSAITITLGFNDLAALSALPLDQALAAIPGTLATYRTNYRAILANITSLAPEADLFLLGYYNPFPADPSSPAAPIFNQAGDDLNAIIRALAGEYGGRYVDVAPAFVGREAELTFQDEQPAGFYRDGPFPGIEPIGNVHPNDAGYAVIAGQVIAAAAVPEPATWAMMIAGFGMVGAAVRRRRPLPA